MTRTTIVVPCFEEAQRLPVADFAEFAASAPDVDFLLVNDGSADATLELLHGLRERHPESFEVIDLQPNRGKAEAVRAGMNAAIERGASYAGYLDADLATPLEEIPNLTRVLDEDARCEIVFGARVQLLGRRIERSRRRHYLGRVFATVASETLGLPVYDTQCGAKLFRVGELTRELFEEPFVSNWVFDVEIIARRIRAERTDAGRALPKAAEVITELPLMQWIDVAGSKVRLLDFPRAIWEIWRIRRRYLSNRSR
jgi:glycosyltransferase involved in cell wall biosynthesis